MGSLLSVVGAKASVRVPVLQVNSLLEKLSNELRSVGRPYLVEVEYRGTTAMVMVKANEQDHVFLDVSSHEGIHGILETRSYDIQGFLENRFYDRLRLSGPGCEKRIDTIVQWYTGNDNARITLYNYRQDIRFGTTERALYIDTEVLGGIVLDRFLQLFDVIVLTYNWLSTPDVFKAAFVRLSTLRPNKEIRVIVGANDYVMHMWRTLCHHPMVTFFCYDDGDDFEDVLVYDALEECHHGREVMISLALMGTHVVRGRYSKSPLGLLTSDLLRMVVEKLFLQ
jgi:hypothetical protein